MENAPLPTAITPKETISESLDIKQEEKIYKLNIEIINQNIILNLINQKEITKEYEKKISFNELKQIHRIFSALNSCQEFLDYMKALIKDNKISVKKDEENKIIIELIVEYLYKQNIIKIILFKKKINFELVAEDLYKKIIALNENYKMLEINYQNITQENNNIKKEIETLKQENKILKEDNFYYKEKINKLEYGFNLCVKYLSNNISNKKENNEIIKDKNNNLFNINNKEEKVSQNNDIKYEDKTQHILEEKKEKEDKKIEKNEISEFKIISTVSEFENQLSKIFFNENLNIDKNDLNDLKKLSAVLLIKGKNPIDYVSEFFQKNLEDIKADEFSKKEKLILSSKKAEILLNIQDMTLIKKIKTKNVDKFIGELRDKYGITEKDICDKDLSKKIIKYKYDEKTIVKKILKKLKYLL